jgi:hypothetical protein
LRLAPLALLAAAALGCAASPPRPAVSARPLRNQLERFFPLVDRHIYTYQTVRGSAGRPEMFMVRVRRPSPEKAELHTGSRTRSLTLGDDFIRRDDGGFVLRAPLGKGASWRGDRGDVRVVDAASRVSVPAGTYEGCVRTVEEVGGDARGTITTEFCPEVGIALMTVEEWVGAAVTTERVELRSFGAPLDIGR